MYVTDITILILLLRYETDMTKSLTKDLVKKFIGVLFIQRRAII